MTDPQPGTPIAISQLGDKYLIFDIDVVSYLRREHHICGVMSGTLPQNPSQNLFLGLPMQIMPEEAQLLLEKGVAYLFDDSQAHERVTGSLNTAWYADYMADVRRKAQHASTIRAGLKEEQKKIALSKQKGKKTKSNSNSDEKVVSIQVDSTVDNSFNAARLPVLSTQQEEDTETANDLFMSTTAPTSTTTNSTTTNSTTTNSTTTNSTTINSTMTQCSQNQPSSSQTTSATAQLDPPGDLTISSITPTTSANLPSTQQQSTQSTPRIPNLPLSYPLYKHLNSKSFFTTPGLRFGCQYCVYPGDPLRFHSHFLAVGYEWDQDLDLMDIVGGGRLGTGVKKGWLIGGEQPGDSAPVIASSTLSKAPRNDDGVNGQHGTKRMRTFSVEWAAM